MKESRDKIFEQILQLEASIKNKYSLKKLTTLISLYQEIIEIYNNENNFELCKSINKRLLKIMSLPSVEQKQRIEIEFKKIENNNERFTLETEELIRKSVKGTELIEKEIEDQEVKFQKKLKNMRQSLKLRRTLPVTEDEGSGNNTALSEDMSEREEKNMKITKAIEQYANEFSMKTEDKIYDLIENIIRIYSNQLNNIDINNTTEVDVDSKLIIDAINKCKTSLLCQKTATLKEKFKVEILNIISSVVN